MNIRYRKILRKKYPNIITSIIIIVYCSIMIYDAHTSENPILRIDQYFKTTLYIIIGLIVVMTIFLLLLIWYKKICGEDFKNKKEND
jgi:cell division protein FtsW (lipid II flippase)